METMQRMVDSLVGLDEDSIVTVITSVLQARPEVAPPIVMFAVPDLTYPPQKALVERRSNGTIKSYSDAKGFGFIDCQELAEVFGNDVFLHASQLPQGCQVGMPVNFAVVLNKDNKPQAYDLQPPGGPKGACKGKADVGWKGDSWKGDGWKGDGWKGDGWKGDGKGGKDKGCWKGNYLDAGAQMMQMSKGKGDKGYGKGPGKAATTKPVENVEVIGDFVGTIKSFNPNNGYGFIDCPDLKVQYNNDVFLHHQQMGGYQVGDVVQFSAFLNQSGKPQGKDLKELQAESYSAKRQKIDAEFGGDFAAMF